MDVPSYPFLGFAAAVALLANVSLAPSWRRGVFAVANIGFILLLSHDLAALAPFAGFLAVGFGCLKLMERARSAALYTAAVTGVLVLFCWLKRYSFVPHEMFLSYAYLTVGLSYVFFRVMHLVIDAYDGNLPDRVGVVSYVSYTLNFTCLFSGPIQLYGDYVRTETIAPAPLTAASVSAATMRIVTGFFKVAVVGAGLQYLDTHVQSAIVPGLAWRERVTLGSLLLGIYPLYLYVNFSGYTDFVIGVARFMRLELPENFRSPFMSEGFMEFWNRWHMTLSNWLKRYVYTPLLMDLLRRYPARELANPINVGAYFVTFFLIGLWHGQTPMFVMYGILLGLGVSANKLYQIVMIRRFSRAGYRALCARPVYRSLSRGFTYGWFAFALVWFWATQDQLKGLTAALGGTAIVLSILLVWGCSAAVLSAFATVWHRLERVRAGEAPLLGSIYARTAWCTAMAVLVVSVTLVLNAPAPVIVYKAF